MAHWWNDNIPDKGLEWIVNNTTEMHLLKTYTQGDDRATVLTNSICTVAMAPGDFTISDNSTTGRRVTVSAKTGTANDDSGAAPDNHVALINATEVLTVTDEVQDQQIYNGNTIDFPAWDVRINFPTAQP